jgi:hypothetical protein
VGGKVIVGSFGQAQCQCPDGRLVIPVVGLDSCSDKPTPIAIVPYVPPPPIGADLIADGCKEVGGKVIAGREGQAQCQCPDGKLVIPVKGLDSCDRTEKAAGEIRDGALSVVNLPPEDLNANALDLALPNFLCDLAGGQPIPFVGGCVCPDGEALTTWKPCSPLLAPAGPPCEANEGKWTIQTSGPACVDPAAQ